MFQGVNANRESRIFFHRTVFNSRPTGLSADQLTLLMHAVFIFADTLTRRQALFFLRPEAHKSNVGARLRECIAASERFAAS